MGAALGRFPLAVFLGFFLFFTPAAFAKTKQGTAAQLVSETQLRQTPSDDAESLGRLPKGTILTLEGDKKNGFALVQVELEKGSIEGWVRRDTLNQVPGADDDDDEEEEKKPRDKEKLQVEEAVEEPKAIRPRTRIVIPKDEAALMRRDQTFFYGLQAGVNYSILETLKSGTFAGIGYSAGAHAGFFLARDIPVRLEVNYSLLSGTSGSPSASTSGASTTTSAAGTLSFGFIEGSLVGQYGIENFELFGGVMGSYGVNNSDVPTGIQFKTAADLSNVSVLGGLGFHFLISDVTSMAIRGKYALGLLDAPVLFQTFTLQFYLQFSG